MYDTLTKNVLTPSHNRGDTVVLSNAQRLAAGCLSGASACVVVFPLETLRTQAAMGQRQMKGAGAYFGLAAGIIRCWPMAAMHDTMQVCLYCTVNRADDRCIPVSMAAEAGLVDAKFSLVNESHHCNLGILAILYADKNGSACKRWPFSCT